MNLFSNKKFFLGIVVYTVLVLSSGYLLGKSGFGDCAKKDDHPKRSSHHMGHGKMTAHFSSTLDLTADQQQKLDEIVSRHTVSINKIRGEFRAKYDGLREKKVGEINAILTPQQQSKFREMRAKWNGKKGKKSHDNKKGHACDVKKGHMENGKDCCKIK
ncbi:MAG: hypothetical protein O3A01_06430 [bacterium]|nr:hypothetical protein [bacterium]